jgi:hypothetical protein
MGKEKGIRGWYNIPPEKPMSSDPKFWEILKTPMHPTMPDFQVKVEKIRVNAKPRKLTATWTIEEIHELEDAYQVSPVKPVPGEPEFWTILKSPPKRKFDIEQELAEVLAAEITKEVDAEILAQLSKEATFSGKKRS